MTTALGAAYLAGLYAGVWSCAEDIARSWSVGREYVPAMNEAEKAEQQKLRQEYLADFRNSFRRQLENTDIKYEDGETVPLTEFKKKSNLN